MFSFLQTARESNKAGHRQMNQLQQAPLKEANKDGTDCKKRKAPCQTVGLDSSISMIQSSQDHNPAINHQIGNNTALEQSRQFQWMIFRQLCHYH